MPFVRHFHRICARCDKSFVPKGKYHRICFECCQKERNNTIERARQRNKVLRALYKRHSKVLPDGFKSHYACSLCKFRSRLRMTMIEHLRREHKFDFAYEKI